jgi:spermidine/putrescine transport system ATP-binding protein
MPEAIDVELTNITKRFGALVAVDDISFQVPRGSFFSILGPSGCGKTTTLKIIAGFEEPDLGDVYIGGQRLNNVPPNHRPVNMVFQQLALFPLMTVFDNVAFGLKMAKVSRQDRKQRVEQMLEKVGLTGLGNRKPSQLSGGQQQRVAIARCLVLDPTVLLLDEPLGALDLKLREQMKIQLKHLQHQIGTTFVYITHDQSEALVMSDQVAVMNNGELLQVGTPDELYSHPVDTFVASFVGENNGLSGTITGISNNQAVLDVGAFQIISQVDPKMELGQPFLNFIRPEKINLLPADTTESEPINQVPGTIQDVIFDGAVARAIVELIGDLEVMVLITRTSDSSLPVAGENVRVAWNPSDAHSFPVNDDNGRP